MAIDGLIILDPVSGRAIIQTSFRSTGPAYPLLHIDAFNDALSKSPQVDPVLYVSSHRGPSACCNMESGGMRFLCPVSTEVDPLFVFAFLQTFIETLQEYLGELSIASLKEHFDVIHQLLEEMLDEGHPLTTEPNALKDIVIPPSFFNKILAAAGAAGLAKATASPFSSPIPWRKTGLRYNHNEILFDITEVLDAIINKQGTVISSQVWGSIKGTSRLSGTPDLTLTFVNPQVISDCSFHPSVRLQRWARDKALSFVPPDGQFPLMDYRYIPVSSAAVTQQVPMSLVLKPIVTLHENGGNFDLTLTSRVTSKAMEQVCIEIFLGDGATGASCQVSGGASWNYDLKMRTLRWEVASVPSSSSHTLRGTFTSFSQHPRPARAFSVTYQIPQYSYSSLKVDQLKVAGEIYKAAKGVRSAVQGKVEVRW